MNHKFAKAKQQKLLNEARKHVLAKGAIPTPDGQLLLHTPVGPLRLSFDVGHAVATVFARFENPDSAKTVADCNPHSGKWNFHWNRDHNPDAALDYFQNEIDRIMNQKKE